MLDNGGGDYFDIMNFHAYSRNARGWATQGVGIIEKTEFIREKLRNYGLEKPVFITESGEHSNNLFGQPSSQEQQNRTIVEVFTQAMAADVEALMWFSLADSAAPYFYENGLVTRGDSSTRKPSFDVYTTALEMLGRTHYIRQLDFTETNALEMEVYQFQNNIHNRTLYVAWLNPIDTNTTLPLTLDAGQGMQVDIFGDSTIIKDSDDGIADNKIQIAVSGRPIYIVIPR